MSFLPTTGIGGYGGWRVLERTAPRQREAFERSPNLLRNIDYFRENISKATSAEALIKDRRLLTVALGAFGLADEINKQAYVERILEGGTDDTESLANRLNEPRFKAFAKAFGYGDESAGQNVLLSSFQEDIIARYKSLEFERAVGEVDDDMRLAMNFKREIATLANGENVDRKGWFQAMGQLPLRTLLTKAFGLPDSVAQLDVDRQKEIFEDKANALFGEKSISLFKDPENVEAVIRRFFLFRQIDNGPSNTTPGYAALSLLQGPAIAGGGLENLLISQS